MPIEVTASDSPINVSASGVKVDANVTGGQGPQGPQGEPGTSGLPPGTEGYVLTYSGGVWVAAAPSGGFSGSWNDLADKPTLFDGSYTSLTNVPGSFTPTAHNQAWSTITSTPTTLSGYGITDAVASNDSRLSDARTPTAHNQAWSTITSTPTTLSGYGITDAASATHTHAASDITSGSLDIARIPTGTSSSTVALGNHTHSQLHDRSHAITSTSDHTAGNWKVIYTNGSGQVVELALGAANTVLQSNGASAAPTFAAVSSESFHPFLLAGM